MKICGITSQTFLSVILIFFSRSSCFIVTYNPVRTSKSITPVSFHRHRGTCLYQDLNGRSNVDIASADKGNNLKSINFSQKTIIAAVVSVAALAITAVVGGLRIDFDFATLLERSLLKIESLGSLGYIYFALVCREIIIMIKPTILMTRPIY